MAKSNQIPDEILNNPLLNQRIEQYLPDNYNFEIHKTIWRIRRDNCKRICLQFPDGLFIFAIPIVDILREFNDDDVEFIIMADVTYGACCIDDLKVKEIDCDMLIHYGHSCLIPINRMINNVKILYIFVDIKFDLLHFMNVVLENFQCDKYRIHLASTIQFLRSLHFLANELHQKYSYDITIPQSRPLTSGEILGCTAPKLSESNDDDDDKKSIIIFIADGRFHLEALMIANPSIQAYRYDPYDKKMTKEYYNYNEMIEQRQKQMNKTKNLLLNHKSIGIIIGTLGRQGSLRIYKQLKLALEKLSPPIKSKIYLFTIAEINTQMLYELGNTNNDNTDDNNYNNIECWIQIGCPRLSIDWGENFSKPLLTPYEFRMVLKNIQQNQSNDKLLNIKHYPMDYYATNSMGNWTPNHKCHDNCQC